MKPLTIEELKNLPLGEWVWIIDTSEVTKEDYDGSMYARKYYQSFPDKYFDCGTLGRGYSFKYADYGTKWTAYKNKEQAECDGEILNLPCKVGDTVWLVKYITTSVAPPVEVFDEWVIDKIVITKRGILFCGTHEETDDYCTFDEDEYKVNWFTDKAQAAAHLKRLKGEK